MAPLRKRIRAANFTQQEKAMLLKLIFKFKHIIGSKKCDGATIRQKEAAWYKIADIFNAQCPSKCYRSVKSIRKLYTNQKKKFKNDKDKEKPCISGNLAEEGPPLADMGEKQEFVNCTSQLLDEIDVPEIILTEDNVESKIKNPTIQDSTQLDDIDGVTDWGYFKSSQSRIEGNSSDLSKKYNDLVDVKLTIANLELENARKKYQRDEIEFHLKKEILEEELKIKKAYLQKLVLNNSGETPLFE